ncbi:hypothetical protein DPMN_141100 [Dreissena polymorpha]|uniref:Secreted protein n=1 Tax=Dreissena polymorpha TaxID=45954 RepID=A0A9D4G903_DREPO|nr:hypothetical protein DPMN_141100 [Dreissena polymorpha]
MLRTNHLPRWKCLHLCVMATWLALYVNAIAETSRVQTWTAWYSTDTHSSGDGDDERVDTIRRRG